MLTKSEDQFLKAYEKTLQQSKWKFILTQGLTWAFVTMVLVTLFEVLLDKGATVFTVYTVLIRLAIWAVGGITYGMWIRSALLKKYRKLKSKASFV